MSSADADATFSTRSKRGSVLPPVIGGLLGAAALLTSLWGERAFVLFISILVAAAAIDLAAVLRRKGFGVSRVLLVAGALGLAFAAYWDGEQRIGLVTALVVIGSASGKVLGRLWDRSTHPSAAVPSVAAAKEAEVRETSSHALKGVAASIFGAILLGMFGAFSILLRDSSDGKRLVWALAAMILGFHIGSWVGTRRLAGPPVISSLAEVPTWWGIVFGVAGSVLGSFVSLTFMEPPFISSAALALGAIVAMSAIVGSLGGRMIRADLGVSERSASVPGLGGLYARLDTLLLTVPAFYYGFRLYLT